jgi:hypothetical protein
VACGDGCVTLGLPRFARSQLSDSRLYERETAPATTIPPAHPGKNTGAEAGAPPVDGRSAESTERWIGGTRSLDVGSGRTTVPCAHTAGARSTAFPIDPGPAFRPFTISETITMTSLRIYTIVAASAFAAVTPAAAQSCLGVPMTGKTYIGAETRETWVGYRRQAPVYGGRIAHTFDAGGGVGITASAAGGGGPMRGDSTAVHASATVSTSQRLTLLDRNLSACASTGLELRGVDRSTKFADEDDGYVSFPLSFGLGYDVHAGALTLTPFAAPTLAFYEFESNALDNGARQRGWDTYVTMGMTAALDRFSVGANYRHGDKSLGSSGRFAFSTGVSF